jgi:hypothetical protein
MFDVSAATGRANQVRRPQQRAEHAQRRLQKLHCDLREKPGQIFENNFRGG